MPPLNAACPWAGCSQVYANLLRASRSLQRVRGRAWRMLTHSTKQDTNVRANCPNVWPLKLNVPHRLQALNDPMQFHTKPTSHGSIRSLKWKNRSAMLLNHVKQLLIDSSPLNLSPRSLGWQYKWNQCQVLDDVCTVNTLVKLPCQKYKATVYTCICTHKRQDMYESIYTVG